MPLDYRRFNGPDDSVSYKRFTADYFKNYDDLYRELIDTNGHRRDGRQLDQTRTLYARANTVSQAKGSAYVEMKKTKLLCSVFDPREIVHQNEYSALGQLFCEVKFAPFSCHHQRIPLVPDSEEKALSVALKKALEPSVCCYLFPNFQIDIFVYILENDGACLAAAINAAGIALVSAAVPMYDVITASTVAIIGEKMFVDPSAAEEHLALSQENVTNHGIITLSRLHDLKQVSDLRQIGCLDVDYILKASDILEQKCKEIGPAIQKILLRNVEKGFEEQEKEKEEAKEREAALNVKMDEWKALLKGG